MDISWALTPVRRSVSHLSTLSEFHSTPWPSESPHFPLLLSEFHTLPWASPTHYPEWVSWVPRPPPLPSGGGRPELRLRRDSERVLTLVSPSPPMSEAHRGGGEVSLPLEKGWVAPLLTPVTLLSLVLPSVTTRYYYEMIHIISNITCTLLKYRVVSMITRNIYLHSDIPLPTLHWPQVNCWRQGTITQRAQLLRP